MEYIYIFGFKIHLAILIALTGFVIASIMVLHTRFGSIKAQEGDKIYVRINRDENTHEEYYLMEDGKFVKFLKRIFKFKA